MLQWPYTSRLLGLCEISLLRNGFARLLGEKFWDAVSRRRSITGKDEHFFDKTTETEAVTLHCRHPQTPFFSSLQKQSRVLWTGDRGVRGTRHEYVYSHAAFYTLIKPLMHTISNNVRISGLSKTSVTSFPGSSMSKSLPLNKNVLAIIRISSFFSFSYSYILHST